MTATDELRRMLDELRRLAAKEGKVESNNLKKARKAFGKRVQA